MISWLMYWYLRVSAWPIYWLMFARRTYYKDKKDVNKFYKGPAIIVSNHKSIKDFPLMMFFMPFRKMFCQMSEAVYKKKGFNAWIMKVMGGIRVDRTNSEMSFLDKTEELLEKGKVVAIFPEGKLSTNGNVGKFGNSYILLALRTGVPIIPVYTDGQYKFGKRCHLSVGKKIFLGDYCEEVNPSRETIESLNKMVRREVMKLGQEQRHLINVDRYGKLLALRNFMKDNGRLTVFTSGLYFKFKAFNVGPHKEKLKAKGPLLLIANHISFIDPFSVIATFWRRRVYILTAEVVFTEGHNFRNWLLKEIGCIRIDRYSNDKEAFEKAVDVLDGGGTLLIFPNGRIHRDESTDDYKSGAALLAARTGATVQPIFLKNQMKKWHKVEVHLGTPKTFKEYCDKEYPSTQDMAGFMDELFGEINFIKNEVENNGRDN